MKTSFQVKIKIDDDVKKVTLQNVNFWTFAATEWWRLITPYTPMDTGTLFESVHIRPKEIEYYQPYAHRVYTGDYMNFRTDKHPLASARWDEVARPTQERKLIKSLNKLRNKLS